MNFFGGTTGNVGGDCGCGYGNDCISIIFLLLLLQNCGGCGKGFDCNNILWLILLLNCGCGNNYCK